MLDPLLSSTSWVRFVAALFAYCTKRRSRFRIAGTSRSSNRGSEAPLAWAAAAIGGYSYLGCGGGAGAGAEAAFTRCGLDVDQCPAHGPRPSSARTPHNTVP